MKQTVIIRPEFSCVKAYTVDGLVTLFDINLYLSYFLSMLMVKKTERK